MAKPKEAPAANTYRYKGIPIRVVFENGDPWFASEDVLDAIEAGADLLIHLADQPDSSIFRPGFSLVSEVGVYRLLFEANSGAARRFRRWFVGDMMPLLYRDEYIKLLRSRMGGAQPARYHVGDNDRAEIFRLRASGLNKEEIARALRRSPHTVRKVLMEGQP